MLRETIREAVFEALKQSGRPLHAKEIYSFIIKNDLYRFNAENPEGIVKVEIRRHCEGVEFPSANQNKYFKILLDGTYWIKDIPVPGLSTTDRKSEINVKDETVNLKSVVAELKAIHSKHADTFKKQLLNQLKEIPAKTFETF